MRPGAVIAGKYRVAQELGHGGTGVAYKAETSISSAVSPDEAIVEAKKALELEPDFWPSYYILRRAYSEKRMHKEAIDAAQRLTELDPTAGQTQMILAYVAAG